LARTLLAQPSTLALRIIGVFLCRSGTLTRNSSGFQLRRKIREVRVNVALTKATYIDLQSYSGDRLCRKDDFAQISPVVLPFFEGSFIRVNRETALLNDDSGVLLRRHDREDFPSLGRIICKSRFE
jgi:hypothetical protein